MLIFPANVKASLKLLEVLEDPDFHLEAAAQLVIADPVIAARLVAVGNSAIFARGTTVDNVRTAVNRLGLRTVRTLVAGIVVRQICSAVAAPAIRAQAEQLWQHCAHVGALAYVIGRDVARIDPDTAMFAGIVHEVGGFYRLYRADGGAELAGEDASPGAAEAGCALTRSVLEALLVPEAIVAAVESLDEAPEWATRPMPPATLADTLHLANELTAVASPFAMNVMNAAAAGIGNPIDTEGRGKTLPPVLAESADEIKSLAEALLV